jgi:hypothetical protein
VLSAADFIYSEYLTTLRKFEFRQLVWQIAADYAAAALLLRLPGYVPMPAFTAIEDVPLVVRHARKSPQQVCALAVSWRVDKGPVYMQPEEACLHLVVRATIACQRCTAALCEQCLTARAVVCCCCSNTQCVCTTHLPAGA